MQEAPHEQPTSSADEERPESPAPRGHVGRRLRLALTVVFFVALTVEIWRAASSVVRGRAEPLPVLASLPEFSLTSQSGRAVTLDDMRGYVWIADFIFTTCTGPCPELTMRMRSLQDSLLKYRSDVRLVSITTDPETDTPKVLTRYARRHHADPELWLFLTGPSEDEIYELIARGFLQTIIPASDGNPIIHSTYFVLVDHAGRIRGFYDGMKADSKPVIVAAVENLLQEPQGR